jgi:hypothetical protein
VLGSSGGVWASSGPGRALGESAGTRIALGSRAAARPGSIRALGPPRGLSRGPPGAGDAPGGPGTWQRWIGRSCARSAPSGHRLALSDAALSQLRRGQSRPGPLLPGPPPAREPTGAVGRHRPDQQTLSVRKSRARNRFFGASFRGHIGRGWLAEGRRSSPVASVFAGGGRRARFGRFLGRRGRGRRSPASWWWAGWALGCGWARVDDVSKRRRQGLVVCRATLPFEGLLCAPRCHARAHLRWRGRLALLRPGRLPVRDHSLVGGLGLLGELALCLAHPLAGGEPGRSACP